MLIVFSHLELEIDKRIMLDGGKNDDGENHHGIQNPAGVGVLLAAPFVEAVLFENQVDNNEGGQCDPSDSVDMQLGQLKLMRVDDSKVCVDLSGYAPGVYFVRIVSSDGITTQKVVKQ